MSSMIYSSSSSDDECDGLLKQALEVALPADFNPDAVPQDGHEYLQHVVYERSRCKKLVIASNIDRTKFSKNQTFRVTLHEKPIGKVAAKNLPSIEWQNDKMESFHCFRKFIESKLCSEANVEHIKEETFIDELQHHSPVFPQFCEYAQCARIRMLELVSKYVGDLKPGMIINDNVGTWIFAILATLEIPLSPSYHHTVREFAKKCLNVRSNLPDDAVQSSFSSLNFYICVVSRYFGQFDLAD